MTPEKIEAIRIALSEAREIILRDLGTEIASIEAALEFVTQQGE